MTLVVHFQTAHNRDFKAYVCRHVRGVLRPDFPHVVSAPRLIELVSRAFVSLRASLHPRRVSLKGLT